METPSTPNKKITWILWICYLLIPLSGFSTDTYAPSLPAITHALNTTTSLVRLTMTVFIIGFAAGQIIFGVLSDHWGRKRILLPALLIFILASFGAANTHSIYILMLMRVIQGLVTSAPSAISKAIINDSLSDKAQRSAFITLGLFWGLGPVLGPTIGGYLQHHFHWQANFIFLGGYASTLFLLVLFVLPETLAARQPLHIGKIINRISVIASYGNLWLTGLLNALLYSYILSFNIIAPFIIQGSWHYSPIFYGYMALCMGVGWMLGSYITRHLHHLLSIKQLLAISCIGAALVALVNLLLSLTGFTNIWTLVIPTILLIMLASMIFSVTASLAIGQFERSLGGTASAVYGTMTFGFSAIFTAGISLIHPHQVWPLACVFLLVALINLGLGYAISCSKLMTAS